MLFGCIGECSVFYFAVYTFEDAPIVMNDSALNSVKFSKQPDLHVAWKYMINMTVIQKQCFRIRE